MNYAGFWRRFVALLIDGIILMIPNIILSGVLRSPFASLGSSLLLGFFYRPFFESSALAGTPGKALMDIAVLSEDGQPLSFKQACIRFFCSYLSTFLLFMGYLIQPFTARRQTLHDIISEAVVIRVEPRPDMNYFKVWKQQFITIIDKL